MNIYILIYIAAVSFFAVIITVHDKNAARIGGRRIREFTLLAVSVFGGSAAMLLTMLAIRHKTRRVKFMAGIPLILLAQAVTLVTALNSSLSVSRYSIETDKIDSPITLALVTDLHSCNYGDGQTDLINAIDEENPNAVLLCGDIFDDGLPPENAIDFIKGISGRYTCFYVSGNHELWSRQADDFKAIAESYGVKVLEGTSEIFEVGNESIQISGT
ncbi:MAG: DUF1294 domain-containing protein, partial [Oscillospiraceae bacterium]|nr:DUF1294 domain-containing protein [Oscillospiraceae bacterium]